MLDCRRRLHDLLGAGYPHMMDAGVGLVRLREETSAYTSTGCCSLAVSVTNSDIIERQLRDTLYLCARQVTGKRLDNIPLTRSAQVRHVRPHNIFIKQKKKKTCRRHEVARAEKGHVQRHPKNPPPERDQQQLVVDQVATDRTTVGSKADDHRAIPIVPFQGSNKGPRPASQAGTHA